MTRIVTTHYRYKRPPRWKKAVAGEVRPETSVKPLFTTGRTGSAAGHDPKWLRSSVRSMSVCSHGVDPRRGARRQCDQSAGQIEMLQ
jgi:hypothetical protein